MEARDLARILREEAESISWTEQSMSRERRLIGWQPDQHDKARIDAINIANHTLSFTLLSIADKLENL